MEPETFLIRSVVMQNIIMGVVTVLILGLLIRFIRERNVKYTIAVGVWAGIAVWFFNGPFWGFSAVTVAPEGLVVHYGFLSVFKNATLPVETPWKIRFYLGGIRRMKKLFYLELGGHKSLKVRGKDKFEILKALGAAIDRINGRALGGIEERPVNMP